MVQSEPRCRVTWAYYHEVPRERLRQIGRTIDTHPAPECFSISESLGFRCERPV